MAWLPRLRLPARGLSAAIGSPLKNATQSAGPPFWWWRRRFLGDDSAQQQQVNPQLQRSLASFNQAAAAIAAQQAAQAAARQTALNTASTVPKRIDGGGLVQDTQPLTQSWLNAQDRRNLSMATAM